jgi:TRAP-type C4-dicarboxylate transport system substrate-binding protein
MIISVSVESVAWENLAADYRDALLDEIQEVQYEAAEMEAERRAEAANERYFEEGPYGSMYAGSQEESRDRWFDLFTDRFERTYGVDYGPSKL